MLLDGLDRGADDAVDEELKTRVPYLRGPICRTEYPILYESIKMIQIRKERKTV